MYACLQMLRYLFDVPVDNLSQALKAQYVSDGSRNRSCDRYLLARYRWPSLSASVVAIRVGYYYIQLRSLAGWRPLGGGDHHTGAHDEHELSSGEGPTGG